MSTVETPGVGGADRPMSFGSSPVAGCGRWRRESGSIVDFLPNWTQTTQPPSAVVDSRDCDRYKFVTYLIASVVALCGLAGNTIAFVVFWKVKKKSSTFFLFQVSFCCPY
jgi:hypothetical protein